MNRTPDMLAGRTSSNPDLRRYHRFHTGDPEHGVGSELLTAKPDISKSRQFPPIVVLLNDIQDTLQRTAFGSSDILEEIGHVINLDKSQKAQKALIDTHPCPTYYHKWRPFAEIKSQETQHQPKIRLSKDVDACLSRSRKALMGIGDYELQRTAPWLPPVSQSKVPKSIGPANSTSQLQEV